MGGERKKENGDEWVDTTYRNVHLETIEKEGEEGGTGRRAGRGQEAETGGDI